MGIAAFQISSLPTNISSATTWSSSEKALYASYLAYGLNIYKDLQDQYGAIVVDNGIINSNRSGFYRPLTLDGVKQFLTLDTNTDLITFMKLSLNSIGVNTNSTTANDSIKNIINPTNTYTSNQQSILSIVATHYNMWGWQNQQAFFKLETSKQPIDEAIAIVGLPAYGNGGNGWENGMLDFYALTKYLASYPIPTKENSDCYSVTDTLNALEGEITSVLNQRTLGTDENYNKAYLAAIAKIKTLYNSFYSKNKCTETINTLEQQQQQNVAANTLQTNADIIAKYAAVGNQNGVGGTDYTNYAIYGVGGVIVLAALFYLFKD